jgi:hypothetical protein
MLAVHITALVLSCDLYYANSRKGMAEKGNTV